MSERSFDVVVIGAGFAGMHMLWRLRQLGLRTRVLEQGGDVGGTWYWNRYPGARCDVPSFEYSYAFDPELDQDWEWTERYAGQPEILRYASHVADRHDLRRDIQFDTRVEALRWDDARACWMIRTEAGETLEARFCITATGCLSRPNLPDIPGIAAFKGQFYHTGLWPHDPVELKGKRVGLIGTGSTGVQTATAAAAEAGELYVFQRTPQFSLPALNRALYDAEKTDMKARYPEHRVWQRRSYAAQTLDRPVGPNVLADPPERRREVMEAAWAKGRQDLIACYADISVSEDANAEVAEFVREKIRAIVRDPATAEALSPRDHPIGVKRIIMDTGYFEIFNQPNVTLVDVRKDPIVEVTPDGVRTGERLYPLDILIVATGYDAVTGPLLQMDVVGQDGLRLRDAWKDGPHTYLGLMAAGFPNLFTITGPGSPSVHVNVIYAIDQHVDWIADCLEHMGETGAKTITAETAAQEQWTAFIGETLAQGLRAKYDSWYLGSNIPGKPRAVMTYVGGLSDYRKRCDAVAADGYSGFAFG